MDATHRKKKSGKGRSKNDFTIASVAPSSIRKMDSKEDRQQEDDDVQLQNRSNKDTKNQTRPDYPKKPPSSYNFFVRDKNDKIVRNNPGMNSMEISSLTGKMFKALSEKKKRKYVELARVAREKYEKEVQDFKEANPITKPVETFEKMEAPIAPTPFFIFCSKKKKQSISWCKKKFPSLADKEKLKWIDLALAEEANYFNEFEKFMAENPHLKLEMTPVLTKEEKLLLYMRDAKPVKPPSTSFYLFASEYPSIPTNKDGTQNRMVQWNASWKALSKKERNVYQERVIAMKDEYNTKLAAYLANLPDEKRRQEIDNCLPDSKGIKRKKGAEMDKLSTSAPFKKSKPSVSAKTNLNSSDDEEDPPALVNTGRKNKSIQAKGFVINKSSSANCDNNNDANLPEKQLISPPKSAEESSEESYEESDSEPEQSNLPKKPVALLAANSLVEKIDSSSSSVRPLWALKQKLYKNEPPKPPKTAAEWHAFEICKVSNIPDKKKKELWKELPKKKRRDLEIEHSKRLEEYEEKFQVFKKGLGTSERLAFEHIKRLQCAADDESE